MILTSKNKPARYIRWPYEYKPYTGNFTLQKDGLCNIAVFRYGSWGIGFMGLHLGLGRVINDSNDEQ